MQNQNSLPAVKEQTSLVRPPGGDLSVRWDDPRVVEEIRKTFAPKASEAEFSMFMGVCMSCDYNPFLREAWLVKTDYSCLIHTGINGYLKVANQDPNYDNYDEPRFEVDERNPGYPVSCTISVWRKDRTRPVTATCRWDEYNRAKEGKKDRWTTAPFDMLEKVTLAKALRRSFSKLQNTYIEEEITYGADGKVEVLGGRNASPKRNFQDAVYSVVTAEVPADAVNPYREYTCPDTGAHALVGETYCYRIDKLENAEPAKHIKMVAYFEKEGVFWDEANKVWRSTEPLKRTATYLVSDPLAVK